MSHGSIRPATPTGPFVPALAAAEVNVAVRTVAATVVASPDLRNDVITASFPRRRILGQLGRYGVSEGVDLSQRLHRPVPVRRGTSEDPVRVEPNVVMGHFTTFLCRRWSHHDKRRRACGAMTGYQGSSGGASTQWVPR